MAENKIMTLDEYVKLPQKYIVSGGLDEDEGFKLVIGKNFAKAREAVLKDANDWIEIVTWAYDMSRARSIVTFKDTHPLRMWMNSEPAEALEAMQALWAEDDTPIPERIRVFNARIPDPPTFPMKGVGTRLRLFSALAMALDPKKYPPYRATLFKAAYERTGYPMPPKGADEAALYEHALEFLDNIVKRAAARGFVRPCNRLEAQSIVWSYRFPERFVSDLPDAAD